MQAGNGHFRAVVMAKSELKICVNALSLRSFGKMVDDDATNQSLDGVKERDGAKVIHGVRACGRVLY